MDGFRLVKLNEVIRQVDIVITCTGRSVGFFQPIKLGIKMSVYPFIFRVSLGEFRMFESY